MIEGSPPNSGEKLQGTSERFPRFWGMEFLDEMVFS